MVKTKHYGRIIREIRKVNRLTIERVAELCDMSYRGLEEIELGDSDPKLSTVLKIAVALNMDLGMLNSCIPEALLIQILDIKCPETNGKDQNGL